MNSLRNKIDRKFALSLFAVIAITASMGVDVAIASPRLDKSFGASGTVREAGPNFVLANSLLTRGSSVLAFATTKSDGGPSCAEFNLRRFSSSGSPDSSFGTGGLVASSDCEPRTAILPTSHGGYVLAGPNSLGDSCLAFTRLLANGNADPQWPGGRSDICFPNSTSAEASSVSDLLIDDEGRLLVSGASGRPGNNVIGFVARLKNDGSLDSSYQGTGRYRSADPGFISFFGRGSHYNNVAGIERIPGNKTLVAGTSGGDMAVTAITGSGKLDRSFGNRGTRLLNPDGQSCEGHRLSSKKCLATDTIATAKDQRGRILLVGTSTLWPGYDVVRKHRLVLTRLNKDGSTDRRFGTRGLSRPRIGEFEAQAAVVQKNGRILVAGSSRGRLLILRFLPNGSIDKTFFDNGKLTATRLSGDELVARDITVDIHGRILILSDIEFGGYEIARVLPH